MIQNFIPDDSDHLKALLATDTVNNHVSMDADEVLAVQNGVFILSICPSVLFSRRDASLFVAYLASSVDDFHSKVLVLMFDDFGEGVFDSGVVRIDEMAIDELNRQ